MHSVPTMEEAWALLQEYNQEEFHLRHARIVSGVLGYFAKEYAPEEEHFWLGTVLALGSGVEIERPESKRTQVLEAAQKIVALYSV